MLNTFITRGVEPVRWLVLIGIAYTLASIIWTFFTTPIVVPADLGQTAAETRNTPSRAPVNVNWILSKHLFGEAGAAPEVAASSNEPAVPTKLQLELQAVFVADVAEDSAAIIAQRGKPGQHYSVGDNLPGNAKLIEVSHDRVYLRRAGVRETLAFPKAKFSVVASEPEQDSDPTLSRQRNASSPTPTRTNRPQPATRSTNATSNSTRQPSQDQSPQELVDQYQERLANDASGTLNELGLEAADGGGYRLGNNASSPYLQRTGLQPGDTIMSVNGRPVGDIQQDRLELENVLAQGSARIEVLRGSRRFFVTVSLKN